MACLPHTQPCLPVSLVGIYYGTNTKNNTNTDTGCQKPGANLWPAWYQGSQTRSFQFAKEPQWNKFCHPLLPIIQMFLQFALIHQNLQQRTKHCSSNPIFCLRSADFLDWFLKLIFWGKSEALFGPFVAWWHLYDCSNDTLLLDYLWKDKSFCVSKDKYQRVWVRMRMR